jgi:hypothetical protein
MSERKNVKVNLTYYIISCLNSLTNILYILLNWQIGNTLLNVSSSTTRTGCQLLNVGHPCGVAKSKSGAATGSVLPESGGFLVPGFLVHLSWFI